MKKLSFLFLLTLLPLMASAQTLIDGIYYYYNIDSKQAAVTSGDIKYTGSVTIPETVVINGVPCSVIMMIDNAFKDCTALTSITIPNSVTEIEKNTFSGCSGLTSVTIGNSVTSIGENAFYGCSSLTSIEIPNSVTEIGKSAFNGCSALTSVTIPNSVTKIGKSAFSGCSALTSITIPNSVTSIGENAFDGTAWYDAWYDNQPDGLIYTGMVAYKYKGTMPQNTSITLKEGTKGIADRVFSKCSGLISITIPNSVITIGDVAFEYCSSLKSIEIPNSVTSIGNNVFYGCTGLTSAKIGNSVKRIGNWTFYNCSSLTSIEIPNSVLSIGEKAFYGCSSLASITIPNSVTSIGDFAFQYCGGLTSVTIPNSVTSIGYNAFSWCSSMKSVTIGSSVTSIGEKAFYDCSGLTSVTIGSSVTLIRDFAFQRCSGLTSVTCEATSVPSTGNNVFYNVTQSSATLYVPASALETYKATAPWSEFGTIIALDDSEPTPAGIAIDETNFPDENFRNWVLARYGLDGVLTADEIASADKISFPDIRVQSLKGIEYFTALGTLYFCDSPITTLDISKNTELTYLGCTNCQLASLDVSKNTKLTSLYCNGNSLTSLDVSQNTALKNLAIYSNQIKGAEMDALIESLPTVSGSTMYAIYGIDEQNEMTTTQVAAAKAKGWTPKYMSSNGRWQDYAGSEPEVMKCATPVVAFYGGKLIFMCETEDVEYKYQIATPLMSEFDGTNVSLPTKIQLIIYATKDGYEPSDTVTKEIDLKALIGQLGDVNGDGEIGMADIMYMVQYILNGKFPNE